jgi:UPF0271 protein
MILNCDMGERGPDHAVDRKLMQFIGLANLACGGHAGDENSVAAFRALADLNGVELSAHLSYPDRARFGRVPMEIPWRDLSAALDRQWALVPDLTLVKFHGALYNDSVGDPLMAGRLAEWLHLHGVEGLLCPPDSEMALAAASCGIRILSEAFLERRYQPGEDGRLKLVPRSHPEACIRDLASALAQAEEIIRFQRVRGLDGQLYPLAAATCCVHSDSPIALELALSVARMLEEEA